MKNEHAQNLNLIKMIKKLSTGTCAGCVFNKLGQCAISDVYITCHDIEEMPKDIKECNIKVTHDDLASFIEDDFLAHSCVSESDDSVIIQLINAIKDFKKETENE